MKIAFTGSHSTGKTTAAFDMASRMKREHPKQSLITYTATGSFCPFPLNTGGNINSQLWRFTNQIIGELEYGNKFDILICDRSICDPIAYTKYLGMDDLAKHMTGIAKHYISSYDEIYFYTISNNNFMFQDGRREINDEFRQKVEEYLFEIYEEIGVYDKLIIR